MQVNIMATCLQQLLLIDRNLKNLDTLVQSRNTTSPDFVQYEDIEHLAGLAVPHIQDQPTA